LRESPDYEPISKPLIDPKDVRPKPCVFKEFENHPRECSNEKNSHPHFQV